jgi:hypothetical protein
MAMDIPTSTVALLSGWSVDWPILGLIAALFALESFSSGSTRTSSISIAFPITFIIYQWLPNTFLLATVFEQLTTPAAKGALFGLLFIAIYFVVHRMLFSFGSSGGDVPQALISGIATTVIVLVFWIQTPGLMDLWHFGSQVQLVFNESVRTWWLLACFATLAYTRG